MPAFDPTQVADETTISVPDPSQSLPGDRWLRIIEHACSFDADAFFKVALNLIMNPNITSSHLFRADILSDSQDGELVNVEVIEPKPWENAQYLDEYRNIPRFTLKRTIVRRFAPRNPTLDKPIAQTCFLLQSDGSESNQESLVVMRPNTSQAEELPWYHPAVQAIVWWHSKPIATTQQQNNDSAPQPESLGKLSVHYQLFPNQQLPLDIRLIRTARNLLQVLHKHGHSTNYQKRGHHDQLLPQKRVQDTYTELKQKHAKRLCENWVEKTEPSKHAFEDLAIAAYLIELWKEMYASLDSAVNDSKPPFPGFADIGCGNGVLTEILILSGYKGMGFDARKRKTWSILSPETQANLYETLFIPQPLLDLNPPSASPTSSSFSARQSLFSKARSLVTSTSPTSSSPPQTSLRLPSKPWHNALFPPGTFIISNHADELTPWTPLLASLTASPFLAIPCCSHNLSGSRFRAPSAFNAHNADNHAPSYFDAEKSKTRAKSVPITIAMPDDNDEDAGEDEPKFAVVSPTPAPSSKNPAPKPESGDLKTLSQASRRSSKQPSAYSSLCEWVSHLSREAGYVVERDMLRIPSTRNVGIIGRAWDVKSVSEKKASSQTSSEKSSKMPREDSAQISEEERSHPQTPTDGLASLKLDDEHIDRAAQNEEQLRMQKDEQTRTEDDEKHTVAADEARDPLPIASSMPPLSAELRRERVLQIARREGADGGAWVARCEGVLAKGMGAVHQ